MKASKRSVHLELVGGTECYALTRPDDDDLDTDDRSDEVDIVISHIRRLTRTATLEYALRVGAVIIHHFYDGDTHAWRSRGPKTTSFRKLAQHPGLPLSPGALYRCVAVFELCDRLNAASRWEHLTASHLRLVIALPPAKQEALLAKANAGRWTVKALQLQVLRERRNAGRSHGGRRPEPPLEKSLKAVTRGLTEYREAIESFDRLSSDDVRESMRLLGEARQMIERLSETLSTLSEVSGDA